MLTPMMAAYLLKPPTREHHEPRWMEVYTGWAAWCLKHRLETTLAALVFFFGSFALVPLLPTGFVPPDDLSQTQVHLSLPPGSTFKESFAAAEHGARYCRAEPACEDGLHRHRRRRSGQRPLRTEGRARECARRR